MLQLSLILLMIGLGLYGLATSRHLIKSIIFLNVLEAAVILFFLRLFYLPEGTAPIITSLGGEAVDPLPQALMITTIVIGASVTALALMMSIKIYHQYGTLDWKILLEKEDNQ
ncbi:sodium:proton antiporter [Isachenkonia alkalipeptolytica]|uniref:Sodium:proton antiporter n=1 Tax=Isachenkonia alkalipeptolytica TaxID=2565777 RepID=A0AA43XK22_9CLOT|nr:sodium:proton antiporter [Isachenkonia alkalipeptolytica]NBG87724.1 sodium:proton antiporter [Isachenkonia alkalipeptolytica]